MPLVKASATRSNGESPSISRRPAEPRIDFNQLTLASLRKYRRYHRLRMKPTSSKLELVAACSEHFFNTPMTTLEQRVIDTFIITVRTAVAAGQTDAKSYGKPKKNKRPEGFMKSVKSGLLKLEPSSPEDIPPSPQLQKNLWNFTTVVLVNKCSLFSIQP